ncbi:MAG: hypothetical protein ACOCTG_02145, partial [Bacteroidota bacterium]
AVSLLEVVASSAIDTLNWPRRKAAVITGSGIILVGIPCAIDLRFLELFDQIAGNVLLVVGALFISLFVGWKMKDPIGELAVGARVYAWMPYWRTLLRWVVPPLLVFVLFYAIRTAVVAVAALL